MKDQLDTLLHKDMDRKNFLKHVGLGFAALTGLAGLLKSLNNLDSNQAQTVASYGYGGGAYGGTPQHHQQR